MVKNYSMDLGNKQVYIGSICLYTCRLAVQIKWYGTLLVKCSYTTALWYKLIIYFQAQQLILHNRHTWLGLY